MLRDDLAAAPDVRLYYSGDANFNVTALFDVNGTTVESYVYDPYGKLTIYNADWSATRGASNYDNSTLYTGQWRDAETGLSNYRRRYYHAGLGRFISPDLIDHSYRYVDDNSPNMTDPSGLIPWVAIWWLIDHALWYGEYCGPGSSAGPPVGPAPMDALDQCCLDHDRCYDLIPAPWWRALPGCSTARTRP